MDVDAPVMRGMSYYLRFPATAFCFVVFGAGGLVFSIVLAPMLWLSTRREDVYARRVRLLVHRGFRGFVRLMQGLRVLTCDVDGIDRLTEPGQVIVATHPTLIDVVFLVSFVPDAVCVVKQNLLRNPLFGRLLRSAGYVGNADANEWVDRCKNALSKGASLILFPEGTRSVPGAEFRLRRGAAYLAMDAKVALTPVRITCQPSILTKSDRWYHVPRQRPHFTICVGTKLPIAIPAYQSRTAAARAITQGIKRYFLEEAPV